MSKSGNEGLHPDYSRYPWKHVNSLSQVFKDSPVLLAMELTTLAIFLALLTHAHRHRRLGVLLAATATGALNELAFTNAPMVNNFWHAQAWLMLGPRLPAWQPALYGFLLYTASQSAQRLRRWPAAGEAAAAGLLGFLLLFPLDAVCVKFVAYTWHDSDPLLAERWLGVAVGNGMFAAAFPACFSWLLRVSASGRPWLACVLSTPAMVVVTLPFSLVCSGFDSSLPSSTGLVALLVAMATTVVVVATASQNAQKQQQQRHHRRSDWTLTLAALLYFAVLLTTASMAEPAAQKSVGFHQPMSSAAGPCPNDTDLSASGHARRVFLCPGDLDSTGGDVDPTCDPSARIDQHWYAVCGRPFGSSGGESGGRVDRLSFAASLAGLAALGMAALAGCQVA